MRIDGNCIIQNPVFNEQDLSPDISGTSEGNKYSAFLYPNPTKNKFTVQLGRVGDEDTHISVLDLRGSKIKEDIIRVGENTLEIDLQAYPAGMYFVTIRSTEGKLTTMKVIRE